MALLPLIDPITAATAYCGGMRISIWTWSWTICPATMGLPRSRPTHATPAPKIAASCRTTLSSAPAGSTLHGMYHPTVSGLDSHTMMLACRMLLVDRQALSEHTTTSSSTKSLGQALRVSLVKPGAYLSESYVETYRRFIGHPLDLGDKQGFLQ